MDNENEMPTLSTYLSRVRSAVLHSKPKPSTSTAASSGKHGEGKLTLVMGNPSADLDSCISAIVASYFYNLQRPSGSSSSSKKSLTYIPLLNLPSVKASELWRLRPELGVAVRLALGDSVHDIKRGENKSGEEGKVKALEQLVTIAEIKDDKKSLLHSLFTDDDARPPNQEEKQDLFLVDHNSPSILGLSDDTVKSRFNVVSCIDHHLDEDFVSPDASPRIITTGIGSCTSLVVQHLRDQGLWPSSHDANSNNDNDSQIALSPSTLQQISKLALAPVLIDTANLTATGDKCSDTDREVVEFLESFVATPQQGNSKAANGNNTVSTTKQKWDRDAFYNTIATAKANSLKLLTMQETFDRDYKVWSETPGAKTPPPSSPPPDSDGMVNIGITSLVKPLPWLVKHAGSAAKFASEAAKFATHDDRRLGVFALLTRAQDGREVVVLTFDKRVNGVLDEFERRAQEELKLGTWDGGDQGRELGKALDHKLKSTGGAWRVWWMSDTSKSRKQIGPLLREAVRNI